MNLTYLEYFYCVAETKNYANASKKLYVSTSAIFRGIKSLEAELGTRLFETDNRQTVLTPAGKELFPVIKSILEDGQKLGEIAKVNSGKKRVINIGVMGNPDVEKYLVRSVGKFVEKNPGIEVNIEEFNTVILQDMLISGELDVALAPVFEKKIVDENIDVDVVFQDELCVIVRKDHPLSDKDAIYFENLVDETIVLQSTRDLIPKDVIYYQLYEKNLVPKYVVRVSTYPLKLEYVFENGGVTFGPYKTEFSKKYKEALVKIPFAESISKPFKYKYEMMTLKNQKNTAAMEFKKIAISEVGF